MVKVYVREANGTLLVLQGSTIEVATNYVEMVKERTNEGEWNFVDEEDKP
jgi:hypothetical protein